MSQQMPAFPQGSYDVLVAGAYSPVFMTKLANVYGVQPQSDEEYSQLLELAGILRDAEENETVKTSSDQSIIMEAADGLKGALAQCGHQHGVPTSRDRLIKQAAADLAQDPNLQQACLEYGNYLVSLQAAAQGV